MREKNSSKSSPDIFVNSLHFQCLKNGEKEEEERLKEDEKEERNEATLVSFFVVFGAEKSKKIRERSSSRSSLSLFPSVSSFSSKVKERSL